MPRQFHEQNNFNGGEWHPKMAARNDLQFYKTSVETLTNFTPTIYGAVERRPGFKYVASTKDSSKRSVLIPFHSPNTGKYVLEFGDYYIRVYQQKGQIIFEDDPYEITSPYSALQTLDIQYEQIGDLMYLTHPNIPVQVLSHLGPTVWSITNVLFFPEASEQDGYQPAGNITLGATSGIGVTVTASADSFLAKDVGRQIVNSRGGFGRGTIVTYTSTTEVEIDIIETFDSTTYNTTDYKLDLSPIDTITITGDGKLGEVITLTTSGAAWRSTDVGRYVKINDGIVEIISYTSTTVVTAEVLKALSAVTATKIWSIEDPAWTALKGYPSSVAFYKGRLWFGRKLTVTGSSSGIYDDLGIGAEDSDAIEFPVQSTISFISSSSEGLIIGCEEINYVIKNRNSNVITPSNVDSLLEVAAPPGALNRKPVSVGSELLYIDNTELGIQALGYAFEQDNLDTTDLLLRAKHFTTKIGLDNIIFVHEPNPVIYAVLKNGEVLCGIYSKREQALGWSKLTTQGVVESICTITENQENEVWCIIKRTINGDTKRYVEVLDVSDGTEPLNGYSDSFITYDGASTTSISGLSHLEGEEVQVKVDGATHRNVTVSSGSITLDAAAEKVTIGLPYTSTLVTLPVVKQFAQGNSMTQRIRTTKPIIRVYNSTIPNVNGQLLPSRAPVDLTNTAVPLYTGDVECNNVGWDRKGQLSITVDKPLPFILLGIYSEIEIGVG